MTDSNGTAPDAPGPTPAAAPAQGDQPDDSAADPASGAAAADSTPRAAADSATGTAAPGDAAPGDAAAPPASGAAPSRPTPHYFRAGPAVMLGIAAVVVIIDQIAKVLAVAGLENGRPIELVGDTVRLVLLRNPGAAFSMGTEFTVVLSVVATLVVAGLIWFSRRVHSRWWAWGLGLILGGAAGNLVDRYLRAPGILQGHVVDYVSVGWWPVFNVADSCLVAGVIVVAVAVLRNLDFDGSRVMDKGTADG